jgi:Tol biopolymer transport system component
VTSAGFDIAVVAADGTGRRSVVAESASEERPRWSPNGRSLAYYSDAEGSWDVYVVDVETGVSRALTQTPGFDGQPAWQPIGSAVTPRSS